MPHKARKIQPITKEELEKYKDGPPKLETITLTFKQFMAGTLERHNLYIIWRDGEPLYVGISTHSVWHRWFSGRSSHMIRNLFGQWRGASPIGEEVARNLPASLEWTVELRHYEDTPHLQEAERELIHQLHPEFNTIHDW